MPTFLAETKGSKWHHMATDRTSVCLLGFSSLLCSHKVTRIQSQGLHPNDSAFTHHSWIKCPVSPVTHNGDEAQCKFERTNSTQTTVMSHLWGQVPQTVQGNEMSLANLSPLRCKNLFFKSQCTQEAFVTTFSPLYNQGKNLWWVFCVLFCFSFLFLLPAPSLPLPSFIIGRVGEQAHFHYIRARTPTPPPSFVPTHPATLRW